MSRGANLSILGLYNNDPTVFDLMYFPDGFTAEDKQNVKDNILIECAEFECLYPNPAVMKNIIGIWSYKELPYWQRVYNAARLEYNPIENYRRTETETIEDGRTEEHTGSDVNRSGGSDALSRTGSDTSTDSGTEALAKTGTDTSTDSGTEALAKTGTDTSTDSGTEALAKTGTVTNAASGSDSSTGTSSTDTANGGSDSIAHRIIPWLIIPRIKHYTVKPKMLIRPPALQRHTAEPTPRPITQPIPLHSERLILSSITRPIPQHSERLILSSITQPIPLHSERLIPSSITQPIQRHMAKLILSSMARKLNMKVLRKGRYWHLVISVLQLLKIC